MNLVRIGLTAGAAAALGACGAPRSEPAPLPPPPQQQALRRPPPPPPPPPQAEDWQDAALGPGDWSYRSDGAASSATYGLPGQPAFTFRCEPGGQVTLVRTGAAAATQIVVRTSSTARTLPARSEAGSPAATLPAGDPLLDAIVFSRGRFSVEAPGLPTLIVPSWPEAARVVEDCRS